MTRDPDKGRRAARSESRFKAGHTEVCPNRREVFDLCERETSPEPR